MPGSKPSKIYKVKKLQKSPGKASLNPSLSITQACKLRRDQDIKAYAEFVVEMIQETMAMHTNSILQKMQEERAQRKCAEENYITEQDLEEDTDAQEVNQLNEIVEQFLNPNFACDIPLEGRLTASPTPSFKIEE